MAALDPSSVKNGKDVLSLYVEREGSEFLLCNLQKDSVMQVNLNLIFDKGVKVTFSLKGQGTLHLTGYVIKDDTDQDHGHLQSKDLNDSIMLAKDKVKASGNANKSALSKKNIFTENDTWKVESKDKSTTSPVKNASPTKKSIVGSPSQKPTPQKKLFGSSKQESDDSSDDDEEEESDDDEDAKQLLRFAQKRPRASLEDDDSESDDSSDESDEDDELPVQKKPDKNLQSSKKLKAETSTPLAGKKSAMKNVAEVIDIEDDSKNGDMDSSIGRTPMPKKKKEPMLIKSALNESKKAKLSEDKDSSSSDGEDTPAKGKFKETDKNKSASQLNTSGEAPSSEKKKKKKKKKAKGDGTTAANESSASVNDSVIKAGSGDLSKAQYSKKLPEGLEYEDLRLGNGPLAKKGRMVFVYYTGKLKDNNVFDSCQPGKSKPFSFKLGTGQVIKGWDLAVEGMKVGGRRRIKIPPNLGYKNQRSGPIPPNSTLYFVVDLKAVL